MSQYLIARIEATENIDVRLQVEVVKGTGSDHLESLTIAHRTTGDEEEVATNWLFAFIGASPRTDWLGDIARDGKGFLLTGSEIDTSTWPLQRAPFLLETSRPGVFAAGDARLASMKRVASAVGEGAMAVSFVHRYLETV